jgi:hypothetical protein
MVDFGQFAIGPINNSIRDTSLHFVFFFFLYIYINIKLNRNECILIDFFSELRGLE